MKVRVKYKTDFGCRFEAIVECNTIDDARMEALDTVFDCYEIENIEPVNEQNGGC